MSKSSSSKIRLCFVGNMLGRNPGYVTSQGIIVSDLMAAAGYQVLVVSSKVNRLARLIEVAQFIIKNAKQIDVLILEVYSGWYMILAETASWLAKRYQIPLIAVLHGGNLPQFIVRHPRLTTRVLKRADALVAPSLYLAEAMQQFDFNIRVIPNVIELENYSFQLRRLVAPRLIWMRSFHPVYNPHLAVKALFDLRQTYQEATLVMAGRDKGSEAEIKQLAQELGLQNAVRFPGFLDMKQKIAEFAQADVYINTNRIDNMPVSVVEACAFGLPVVATDVGGVSRLLSNGKNGLLVPSDDAMAMSAAIKDLLRAPELAERLSRNGRLLAEQSSWKMVRQNWEDLFLEVAR